MINFLLLVSRQGKTRLTKWYESFASKDKVRIIREVTAMVLGRPPKMCNFIEWRDKKIVYKRYASLFFISCIDKADNEVGTVTDSATQSACYRCRVAAGVLAQNDSAPRSQRPGPARDALRL